MPSQVKFKIISYLFSMFAARTRKNLFGFFELRPNSMITTNFLYAVGFYNM